MKISTAITKLTAIQNQFGDIEITGGHMADDVPPRDIMVTDKDGYEIWPDNPNGVKVSPENLGGVFIE